MFLYLHHTVCWLLLWQGKLSFPGLLSESFILCCCKSYVLCTKWNEAVPLRKQEWLPVGMWVVKSTTKARWRMLSFTWWWHHVSQLLVQRGVIGLPSKQVCPQHYHASSFFLSLGSFQHSTEELSPGQPCACWPQLLWVTVDSAVECSSACTHPILLHPPFTQLPFLKHNQQPECLIAHTYLHCRWWVLLVFCRPKWSIVGTTNLGLFSRPSFRRETGHGTTCTISVFGGIWTHLLGQGHRRWVAGRAEPVMTQVEHGGEEGGVPFFYDICRPPWYQRVNSHS